MSYTIKEIANMMNVTTATIRYYDAEGLLPNVKRVNGIKDSVVIDPTYCTSETKNIF